MTDWQPIETAPKDGTRIIIGGDHGVDVAYWNVDKGRYLVAADPPYWEDFDHSGWALLYIHDNDNWFDPTHWTPLPHHPNQQQDKT